MCSLSWRPDPNFCDECGVKMKMMMIHTYRYGTKEQCQYPSQWQKNRSNANLGSYVRQSWDKWENDSGGKKVLINNKNQKPFPPLIRNWVNYRMHYWHQTLLYVRTVSTTNDLMNKYRTVLYGQIDHSIIIFSHQQWFFPTNRLLDSAKCRYRRRRTVQYSNR